MRQKFQMDRYVDDLDNMEQKLNRLKLDKGGRAIKKELSHNKDLGNDLPQRHHTFQRPLMIDRHPKAYAKDSLFYDREDSSKHRILTKHDQNILLTETNQTIRQIIQPTFASKTASVESDELRKLKAQKEYLQKQINAANSQNSQLKNSIEQDRTTILTNTAPAICQQKQLFSQEINQVQVQSQSKSNSNSALDQLIFELRRRDSIFKIIEQRFKKQNSNQYKKLLQDLFQREILLTKIVEQFKIMNSIQIGDLQQLLYFIKSE